MEILNKFIESLLNIPGECIFATIVIGYVVMVLFFMGANGLFKKYLQG